MQSIVTFLPWRCFGPQPCRQFGTDDSGQNRTWHVWKISQRCRDVFGGCFFCWSSLGAYRGKISQRHGDGFGSWLFGRIKSWGAEMARFRTLPVSALVWWAEGVLVVHDRGPLLPINDETGHFGFPTDRARHCSRTKREAA